MSIVLPESKKKSQLNPDTSWKHGAIILFDLLGSKNKSSNTQEFIEIMDYLYSVLDKIESNISDLITKSYPSSLFNLKENLDSLLGTIKNPESSWHGIPNLSEIDLKIDIQTFSDTVLVALYAEEDTKIDHIILYYSAIIMKIIFGALFTKFKLFIRGAIAIGDFYLRKNKNKSIITGPPLLETAELYERTNWSGIVTTPSAELTIENIKEEWKLKNAFENLEFHVKDLVPDAMRLSEIIESLLIGYIKYDIPLKISSRTTSYALNWTYVKPEVVKIMDAHLNDLLDFKKYQTTNVNFDQYEKYRNTKDFFSYANNMNDLLGKLIDKIQNHVEKINRNN